METLLAVMLLSTLFLQALLIKATIQQKDPLNDFCRRFGHQSAIVDRKLYLDGGLLDWNPISQNPLNLTSKFSGRRYRSRYALHQTFPVRGKISMSLLIYL